MDGKKTERWKEGRGNGEGGRKGEPRTCILVYRGILLFPHAVFESGVSTLTRFCVSWMWVGQTCGLLSRWYTRVSRERRVS